MLDYNGHVIKHSCYLCVYCNDLLFWSYITRFHQQLTKKVEKSSCDIEIANVLFLLIAMSYYKGTRDNRLKFPLIV